MPLPFSLRDDAEALKSLAEQYAAQRTELPDSQHYRLPTDDQVDRGHLLDLAGGRYRQDGLIGPPHDGAGRWGVIVTTLAFRSAFFLGVSHLAGQAVTLHPIRDRWLPRYGFEVRRFGVRIGLVRSPSDARLPGGIPRVRGVDLAPGRGGCAEVLRMGPPLGDVSPAA